MRHYSAEMDTHLEPCGNCGELKKPAYRWSGRWKGQLFIMRFCDECGIEITIRIRKGINK